VTPPLPDIEVHDVGTLACDTCGDEMRLSNFCPTCHERGMQRLEALEAERQKAIRRDHLEAKRRARAWQLGRGVAI
jgi:predicted HD phosphohydrolase